MCSRSKRIPLRRGLHRALTDVEVAYLQQAIALSRASLDDGDGAFGAVLVNGLQVLAESRNRTVVEGNPTAHAEMVAIRVACDLHGAAALEGSTLFASCEPCPMCFAASYYAGVARIVYAAHLDDAVEFGSGDRPLSAQTVNRAGGFGIELLEGPGRDAVRALFQEHVQRYGHL